jgi:succinate dehydrogenase / fumarate reductase cytochrome b subunit
MDHPRAFVMRRLHAIAGVVPLGVFVVVHLLVNASALAGPARFDRVVGGLARLPFSGAFELLFVGVPLAFHALYGLRRAVKWPADAGANGYGRPRLDVLMRITSLVLVVFVVVHAWELRIHRAALGGSIAALHTRLAMHLSSTAGGVPWIALGYLAGIAAACFHLAYGCHAVLAASGRASRRTAIASIGGGALLFVAGATTVIALATGGTVFAEEDPAAALPCGPEAPAPSPTTSR